MVITPIKMEVPHCGHLGEVENLENMHLTKPLDQIKLTRASGHVSQMIPNHKNGGISYGGHLRHCHVSWMCV